MLTGALLCVSVLLTAYLLRKTIWISHKAGLYDHPSECRKVHTDSTPHLGGAAIFLCLAILAAIFPDLRTLPDPHILFLSAGILFLVGLADDLAGMNPYKKLLSQVMIALVLASSPAYRITNLHGVFGLGELNTLPSYALTVLFVVAAVNALNLIDGINCLASGISLAGFTTFAYCFQYLQDNVFLSICAVMSGSLAAFIAFNRTPARIFLGDSGSLLCGLLLTVCAVRLLQQPGLPANTLSDTNFPQRIPMIISAALFIPFFDMIRVFVLRILSKRAPFSADRSHIHHRLLDAGYSHMQASSLLIAVSLFAESMAVFGPVMPFPLFLAVLATLAGSLSWLYVNRENDKETLPIPGLANLRALSEKSNRQLPSGPDPQFMQDLLIRRPFDKKDKSKKMEKMQEVEVPVE